MENKVLLAFDPIITASQHPNIPAFHSSILPLRSLYSYSLRFLKVGNQRRFADDTSCNR